MGLRRIIKRKAVKVQRKIFGKDKEVMITTGKGGLTKDEIKGVLSTLGSAIKQGKIPPATYSYSPPTFIDRREALWIIPKTVSVATLRAKIRVVMKAKYGTRYIVA